MRLLAVDVTFHDDARRALVLRPGGLRDEVLAAAASPDVLDGVFVFNHVQAAPGHPLSPFGISRITPRCIRA